MLDHKKPFALIESPTLEFETRLPLADIAGYSAVVVLPTDIGADNWQVRFDSEFSEPLAVTPIEQQMKASFSDSLRSIDELQDEFGECYDFHSKKADLQLAAGDIEGAIASAERALQIDASKGGAYRLGSILIDERRLDEASRILTQRGSEISYMERLRLAQIAVLQGDVDGAQVIVEKAIEQTPTDYRGLMFIGTLYLGRGEYQLAVRYLRAAAEESDQSAKLHVNLAVAHLALRQKSKALHELHIASHIDGLDVNAVVLLSKLAVEKKRYSEALNAIDRHYRAGGRSREFLDYAAHLYFTYADETGADAFYYNKARELLNHLREIDAASAHWNNLGVIDDRIGKPERATRMFSRAFQIAHDEGEDFSLPLSNLLVEHIRSRNYEGVLRAADEFFATKDAYDVASWGKIALQKAAALEGLNRRDEAAEYIEDILAGHEPAFKDHRQMLSTLAVHHASVTGDVAKLSAALKQISAMGNEYFACASPNEVARLRNNIAFAYLILNDVDSALPYLQGNRNRVGKDYYITATQGLYLICKGDFEKGQALYQQAISIAPNKTEKARVKQRMYFQLGKYYESLPDLTEAIRAYRKCLKVKYGYMYLQQAAEREVAQLNQR